MEFNNVHTRFRAYQLGSKGSSFSYWDSKTNIFCLGEARYNEDNIASIKHELRKCGKTSIDELYISSWDADHCNANELLLILNTYQPQRIYYPRHKPDKEKQNQVDSKKFIERYNRTPPPIKSDGTGFPVATPWSYSKTFYVQELSGKANDDSLICLWRNGNFSVLSVGDLESAALSEELSKNKILQETDILILSHHGSSKNFTTSEYLKAINPSVCIALVDRQNQYGHPDESVRKRVNETSWYFSTKDGDVIIESTGVDNEQFTVFNYISNGENLKLVKSFTGKKILNFRKEQQQAFKRFI